MRLAASMDALLKDYIVHVDSEGSGRTARPRPDVAGGLDRRETEEKRGLSVTDNTVRTQPDSTEPTTWAFSDYGEWLDEGTAAVQDDMGRRVPSPAPAKPSFVTVPPADYLITVVHDEEEQAYKAVFGDEVIGYLTYRLVGGRVALWNASVLPNYRDHGIAAVLIARALDDIRASGRKVTVICPIVRMVIDHHPQYEDLVDKEHPGVRIKRQA